MPRAARVIREDGSQGFQGANAGAGGEAAFAAAALQRARDVMKTERARTGKSPSWEEGKRYGMGDTRERYGGERTVAGRCGLRPDPELDKLYPKVGGSGLTRRVAGRGPGRPSPRTPTDTSGGRDWFMVVPAAISL
jgi:hypothetical protein